MKNCLFCPRDTSTPYCRWCLTYNPNYRHNVTRLTPTVPPASWKRLGMWGLVGSLGLQEEHE